MKKYSIYAAFAALSLISCAKEEVRVDSDEIVFEIGLPETKATSTAFERGDAVSLWATEYINDERVPLQIGGNYFNNESLRYNGTSWSGSRPLYWSDKACDFYAVYPYLKGVSSVEFHSFSVSTDQNTVRAGSELGGYEASDIMFARAENVSRADGSVQMSFKHLMAKCTVNIVKGESFEGAIPDDVAVHIYNTIVDATLNVAEGKLSKDPFGARKTITMHKVNKERFEAVIVPQRIENDTPLIEVTMGGIAYLLECGITFKPAYNHTINLTLNTSPDQEQIEISIDPGINPWG